MKTFDWTFYSNGQRKPLAGCVIDYARSTLAVECAVFVLCFPLAILAILAGAPISDATGFVAILLVWWPGLSFSIFCIYICIHALMKVLDYVYSSIDG